MSDFSAERLHELLQVAEKRPLTAVEQAKLQKLLAQDEALQAASAHQFLRSHYVPSGYDRAWSPDELAQISADVHQRIALQNRRQHWRVFFQRTARAAAVFALLFGVLVLAPLVLDNNIEPAVEQLPGASETPLPTATPTPTVTPTATPQPTPTLPPNYLYADLLVANVQNVNEYPEALYQQTVEEAAAQWDGDLYLPRQLLESWLLVGALVDETNGVVEIAFVQEPGGTRWILSQAPVNERELTPPLSVSYQPLVRIDDRNIYDDEAEIVGEFPGHAYQYEYVYREGNDVTWTVYNTVTWQQDGQLFTLTMIDNNLRSTTLIASIAEKLLLQLVESE